MLLTGCILLHNAIHIPHPCFSQPLHISARWSALRLHICSTSEETRQVQTFPFPFVFLYEHRQPHTPTQNHMCTTQTILPPLRSHQSNPSTHTSISQNPHDPTLPKAKRALTMSKTPINRTRFPGPWGIRFSLIIPPTKQQLAYSVL